MLMCPHTEMNAHVHRHMHPVTQGLTVSTFLTPADFLKPYHVLDTSLDSNYDIGFLSYVTAMKCLEVHAMGIYRR